MKVAAGVITAVCMLGGVFVYGLTMLVGLNGFTEREAGGAMAFGAAWVLVVSVAAVVASVLLTDVFAARSMSTGAPVLAIVISVGGAAVLSLLGLIVVAMLASAGAR